VKEDEKDSPQPGFDALGRNPAAIFHKAYSFYLHHGSKIQIFFGQIDDYRKSLAAGAINSGGYQAWASNSRRRITLISARLA
jgi:hypothetical protein